MTELRCWHCGVEPRTVVDVSTISQAPGTVLLPAYWPPADHPHAVTPPTPEQLADEGHRILRRILEDDS